MGSINFYKNKSLILTGLFAAILLAFAFVFGFSTFTKYDEFANAEETEGVQEIYQYYSELCVGQTQKVAVEFVNADDAATSKIVYRKIDSDTKLILNAEDYEAGLAVYSVELSDNSFIGTYIFDKVVWGDGQEFKTTINDDSNFLGQFNVTAGSAIDLTQDDLPSGIYNLNSDGTLTATDVTGDQNTTQFLMNSQAVSSLGSSVSNGLKVGIDPGHGGSDPGACYGNLREADINWDIACACQDELNNYNGVSTYMTRSYNECPGLQERVERCRAAGCNLFACLHINSGGGSGTEVWIQHAGGWQTDLCYGRGADIGNKINAKISSTFGIANRGLKWKYCTDGATYPDGSQGDYYTVLYYSRYYSIPGFLVEHAFVDGDNGLLSSSANRTTMGKLDAQAIAESYGLSKGGGENIVGTYYIEMQDSSNSVLDVADASTADKANVQIGTKSGCSSQKWRVITDNAGWATIINVNSGKALDVAGGVSTSGTNVEQYTMNLTDAQMWAFIKNDDGTYKIKSRVGNNQVLDVDGAKTAAGTNVQIYADSGLAPQKFKLTKIEQPDSFEENINGTFTIQYSKDTNQVLDIAGGLTTDGANLQTYAANGSNAQKFQIVTGDDGYATITNVNSGKVLDVAAGLTYPNTNIQQYGSNSSDAQKWHIIKNSDDTYTFVPKSNENTAMDVAGGTAASGTNVWTYYLTFATSQKFILHSDYDEIESTATVDDGFYQIANSDNTNASLEIAKSSTENGGLVDLATYSIDDTNKTFQIIKHGNYYYFINLNSGKALDCGGTSAETQVHQWTLNYANENQMWAAISTNGTDVKFQCRANKGFMASAVASPAVGSKVITTTSTTLPQTWSLISPNFNEQSISGEFYISTSLNYGKVLDVAAGSNEDRANVQIYDINRTGAQKWQITCDDNNICTIKNTNSGKVLDVAGGTIANSTNVQQYTSNDTAAQKWLICKSTADSSKYIIRNVGNPWYCLDLSGANTENGSNIQIYKTNNSAAQKFELTTTNISVPESATLTEGKYAIQCTSTRTLNFTGTAAEGANANIVKYAANVGNQAFNIVKAGNYYQIKNAMTGAALAVSGVNACAVTADASSNSQLWSAVADGSGYKFVNVATGLYLSLESSEADNTNVIGYSTGTTWSLTALTSPQGEANMSGTYYIGMSTANWQVFDVAGGSSDNGANVQIYGANYTGAQKWEITSDSNGIATVKNAQSGKVLDIAGGTIASGTNVWQYAANGTNAQKFKLVKDGSGYRIYSATNDYICIDIAGGSSANGANVQVYSANGTDAQKFALFSTSVTKPDKTTMAGISETTYRIATAKNANYVLDIAGGNNANGTNIQLYGYNASGAQIFRIAKDSSGYYVFINVLNGKCLDVDSGGVLPGTNVQLWDRTDGNANQEWAAYAVNDGYIFQNVASGQLLDLAGGTVSNGSNIWIYTNNGSTAQHWTITETKYTGMHPVMNSSTTNVTQMVNYWNSIGKSYPSVYASKGAADITAWCQACCDQAASEGVDPAVLFCQAMLETGWLQFSGRVTADQCNFGGLGATDSGGTPATFSSVQEGLLAQSQHLKGYSSTANLNRTCVDPRFHYLASRRGVAPYVEQYGNGVWTGSADYGQKILNLMNALYTH